MSQLAHLIDIVVGRSLADLEALLLLDIVRRWPSESFCDRTIMRVQMDREAALLRVSCEAVHQALGRLARRRLVWPEKLRGKLHVRLSHELLQLVRTEEGSGCSSLENALLAAIAARPSQGRDRVVLLELLTRTAPGTSIVLVSPRDVADRLGMKRQSVTRIVTRLVCCGAVVRVPGGVDLIALRDRAGATSRQDAVSS